MAAAPLRTAISNTYPNPDNGTARTGFGALWDWATGLLGTAGTTTAMLSTSKILDPSAFYNLSLVPSVAANALTMKLTSADGATALSASNPGTVAQRSSTLTSGICNVRNITADISTVISSGSTAGHVSAVAGFIYWYLLDNAGTQELAWSTKNFGKAGIVTTTAEGGIGTADTATVIYSTAARSSVPFRLIGRTTDTQTVAGTWAAAPTLVELHPFEASNLFSITNSIGSAVALNNVANYFTGPSVAQGSVGKWLAMGTVTCFDSTAAAIFWVELWDGTTMIASTQSKSAGANIMVSISLAGTIESPAGNIRISVKDSTSTSGFIQNNTSGSDVNSSTLTAIRVA